MPAGMLSRRDLLTGIGSGTSAVALQTLLAADAGDLTSAGTHFAPTATSVIFLFMSGGPSQVDMFDPKPELARLAGQDVPASLAQHVPQIKRAGLKNLMASPWDFQQHGESGLPVSSLLPETAKHIDDLCIIRSMQHRNPVHGPGECVALTGTGTGDRPSIGAWSLYGFGRETADLPAFITMNLHSDGMQYPQAAGWGAGFLPPQYQGTVVNPAKGIRDVVMPEGFSSQRRREQLAVIEAFNRRHLESLGVHPELDARIQSYEMAFRLQTAAPELFDLADESAATRQAYGLDAAPTQETGRGCLLARRMVERGVRFIQIMHGDGAAGAWDAHSGLKANHQKLAAQVDQPIAGLIQDLKQRGLLKETIVVFATEFGRTPGSQNSDGRDHHPYGFSVCLAGGGIRGGTIHGQTDEIGFHAVEHPHYVTDIHATLLHQLGLNPHRMEVAQHKRLEQDFGHIIHPILS